MCKKANISKQFFLYFPHSPLYTWNVTAQIFLFYLSSLLSARVFVIVFLYTLFYIARRKESSNENQNSTKRNWNLQFPLFLNLPMLRNLLVNASSGESGSILTPGFFQMRLICNIYLTSNLWNMQQSQNLPNVRNEESCCRSLNIWAKGT